MNYRSMQFAHCCNEIGLNEKDGNDSQNRSFREDLKNFKVNHNRILEDLKNFKVNQNRILEMNKFRNFIYFDIILRLPFFGMQNAISNLTTF